MPGLGDLRTKRLEHAAVGEHRVESRDFFHGDFASAEGERQSVIGFGLEVADAGAFEELVKAWLSQLICDPDGRHVTATTQGVLCRKRPNEGTVELLRRERAERSGH